MYYKIEQLKNILASHKNCVFSLDHLCSSALEYIQHLEAGIDRCYALAKQIESAQPKWISVEDELPKKWRENDEEQTLVNYQIYSPRYGVDIGNYVKPAGRWVIMGLPVDNVTHWMPLPEPPKEG